MAVQSEPIFRSVVATIIAEIALANLEYDRALATADEEINTMRSTHLRPYLSEVLHREGRAVILEARAEAEAVGSRRSLWPILAELSRLEAERSDRKAADALLHEAREVIAFIADHAGTRELRESFLARQDVRNVIGAE